MIWGYEMVVNNFATHVQILQVPTHCGCLSCKFAIQTMRYNQIKMH